MAELELLPVARRSVADGVHDQLRRAILAGLLPPGSALPGERELASRFEVNRHAVRAGRRAPRRSPASSR